jgi:predicted O-linked N-acetylglucosamine transferase (SPINDLY family)
VTRQLRQSADVWREVSDFSDFELAECIRADGIDILVDLAMHCPGNRLPVFAHRPAPVQVSWLGYPGSAGMEAIDYRLTDERMDPMGQEDCGAGEEVVRLADSWCSYAPIAEFPPVGPLPAARSGTVTFGSFNEFRKIHEGLVHCWARLLEVSPESRLLMICPKGQCQDRTRALFAAHGIPQERVELIEPLSWPDFIRLFARVDIALDSFPCNGMTTTCHALWMGVPVVTLAGRRAMSRAGDSLLHAMGLPEWVARSEEEYIRIATERAADLPRLAELRATLRARMQVSPLMDGPRFARNVEAAYRTMWRRWCARETLSASIAVRSFPA